MNKKTRIYAFALTLLSAFGRLIPHLPNVTPLGASCLFAGSRLAGLWAYLLPLAVMAVTDPLVGGYTSLSPVIYGCFLLNVFIGRRLLGKFGWQRPSPVRVGVAAFLCSLQFFLITNFGIWAVSSLRGRHFYTADFSGLLACYALALPFWARTLAGDLAYSAAIFGVYALLERSALLQNAETGTVGTIAAGEQRV